MKLMKWGLKPHSRKVIACMVALIMLLSMLGLGNPGTTLAKTEESDPADYFEVWLVDPVNSNNKIELVNYSIAELEQMPQVERAYSSTDSLPAPVFTAAKGIDLIDFLESHKFDMETVTKFKFRATDFDNDNLPPSFGKVLQASNLLDPDRYYFPKIQECWDEYWDEDMENPSNTGVPGNFVDGSDEYTRAEQQLVRPMLGIISYGCRAIASDPGKPVNTEPRFDLMDGTTRLRLCYGQKYPGECITMHFLKWTYKMEVTGKLLPIVLTPDTTDNNVGSPIEITFEDNIAWQNGITAVSIGDNLLAENQYAVTPGKITIDKDVFTAAGTYIIKVTSGFNDSTVVQQITEAGVPALPAPPILVADSSNNTVGQAVYITFTDDATWRDAITAIEVGDSILTDDQYSISEGKITIAADAFPAAGIYTIVIKATGFQNAIVQQIVGNLPAVLESIETTKPAAKLIYSVGETLDITGLEVTGHYSNGSSRVEAITAANISGFDSSNAVESQTLTITIRDKIATYKVTICKPVTAADDDTITVIPGTPLIITVPEDVTNTVIQVSPNSPLPLVRIDTSQVDMTVASGTTVSGSDTIQLPEVMPASSVDVAIAGQVDLVIKVGSDSDTITFSKPVRLVLKGQGKRLAGFIDNDGEFHQISKPESLSALTGNGDVNAVAAIFEKEELQDGAVDAREDLVIWAKHFTEFIAYTPLNHELPIIPIPEIFEEFFEFEEIVRTQTISSRGAIIKIAGVMFLFPANAVSEDIEVSIKKLSKDNVPSVPSVFKLLGEVYEITTDKKITFNKPVTMIMYFDKDEVDKDKYDVGIYCWSNREWVLLDQVQANLETGKVSGTVNHFSIFAVLLSEKGEIVVDEEKEPAQEVVAPVKRSLKDITGHWAEASINKLVNTGIIGGYPDGTFKPDNSITRAEFVTMLIPAFKIKSDKNKIFSDNGEHWARDAISAAAAHGIVSGYDETTFGPDDLITREQMAVMISKAASLYGGEGKTFADSAVVSDWAKAAVAAASGKSIIGGYPDNTFRPQAHATRAEAVTIIVKALN